MKTVKYFLMASLVLSMTLALKAQDIKITGKVTSIDGAVSKAKVELVNSNITVLTSDDGSFIIAVPTEDCQLTASYKGDETTIKVLNVNESQSIYITPSEKKLYKAITLNEELRLCDLYLKAYPDGKNIASVNAIKEKLFFIEAYNIAAAQFSDTALRNYLKLYPEGNYVDKANDAIEIAAWQKARYDNTVNSYKDYLNQYPNGKAAQMAKEKIATLK